MIRFLGVFAGCALLVTACGDNTKICGPGTEDNGAGTCVASATPPMCTDGTILNPTTNACEIDPASCQDGTVLINNECVDPTSGLFPDVQEGAEPNGFGLGGEPSSTPAGSFVLKAIGGPGVILHGTITPRPDRDEDGQPEPDYDTYLVDVAGPSLLRVTADGIHGLSAGFFAVSAVPALADWIRFGVNLSGDTTKRGLYLPSAGRYAIVIADARSLTLDTAVGTTTTDYYVTIDQLAVPAPTALALTGGAVTTAASLGPEDVLVFTAPMGIGLNEVSLSTDGARSTAGLVVSVGMAATDVAAETKSASGAAPARTITGGIDPNDVTLIVVDPESNTFVAPVTATLSITTHAAAPLSLIGGTATRHNAAVVPAAIGDLAAIYFDAAAAGELIGLDLSWNTPVDGVLVDEHGAVASAFSWDPGSAAFLGFFGGFGNFTWDGYRGVFRAPAPGRYYFLVNDPFGAVGDDLIATSMVATLTPTALAFGTPLTAALPGPFDAATFDYAGDAEPWQRATLTASAGSGGATTLFYDANTTAGRLGTLVLDDQFGGGPTTDAGDGVPLLSVGATATSTGTGSRVMLNGPQHLLAIATTGTGTGTFDLGIAAQTYTDDGTHQGPFSVTHSAQTLDLGTFRQLYLLRTAPNNVVTVTAHPVTPTLDLEIASLAADETVATSSNTGGASVDEVLRITADERGYVAIQVESAGGVLTGQFAVTIEVAAPFYPAVTVTTAWTNACIGGTDVTPADRDDGFTGAVVLPAGFDFFAAPVTQIKISTNGWFTFDAAAPISASASRNEQRMPSAAVPDQLVAAYWDDLDQVRICTKAVGTTFVVQWRGVLFSAPSVTVAAQAILDTADDSVTLVYAPYHEATGTSASAGVEDATANLGTTVFYRSSAVAPGSATKLAHP